MFFLLQPTDSTGGADLPPPDSQLITVASVEAVLGRESSGPDKQPTNTDHDDYNNLLLGSKSYLTDTGSSQSR